MTQIGASARGFLSGAKFLLLLFISIYLPTLSFPLQEFETLKSFRKGSNVFLLYLLPAERGRDVVARVSSCSLSGGRRYFPGTSGRWEAKAASDGVERRLVLTQVS